MRLQVEELPFNQKPKCLDKWIQHIQMAGNHTLFHKFIYIHMQENYFQVTLQ